jgi:predicted ATP-dependent serine protease
VPTQESLAAFGEIGLTGRLRQAAQAERRLEECAKLGIKTVITPAENDTLAKAVAAALAQSASAEAS